MFPILKHKNFLLLRWTSLKKSLKSSAPIDWVKSCFCVDSVTIRNQLAIRTLNWDLMIYWVSFLSRLQPRQQFTWSNSIEGETPSAVNPKRGLFWKIIRWNHRSDLLALRHFEPCFLHHRIAPHFIVIFYSSSLPQRRLRWTVTRYRSESRPLPFPTSPQRSSNPSASLPLQDNPQW